MRKAKIESITPSTYTGLVYNLEVETDNSYCTDAFVVHNCDPERSENSYFDLPKLNEAMETTKAPFKTFQGVKYWTQPESHRYGIGADIGEGSGKDSSTITVFDFTTNEIIATYHNNKIEPILFAKELMRVGYEFNTCIIAPERNNNGVAVLENMRDYPNIYQEVTAGNRTIRRTDRMGWHTNKKSLVNGTKVLTVRGWVPIELLTTDDRVYGSDGLPHSVLGVYPQGELESWAVTTSDGASIDCSADHLWTVKSKYYKHAKARTLRTDELVGKKLYIERVAPIQLNKNILPLDPYLFGLLLGDGGFSASISFTSIDEELVEYVRNTLKEPVRLTKKIGDNCTYSISRPRLGYGKEPNYVQKALTELGVRDCRSRTKFIPELYKTSSTQDRYDILRGLMDTDGTICKQHLKPSFTSTSEQLAKDVRDIVLSLGGYARILVTQNEFGPVYTVSLQTPQNPFKLNRKANLYSRRTDRLRRRNIVSVKKNGTQKHMTCIAIASKDELYVTEDYLLTHNSKPLMFDEFRRDFNKGIIKIHDIEVLKEMRSFSYHDISRSDTALVTRHNDLLTSAVIAWQMRKHATIFHQDYVFEEEQPTFEDIGI